MQLLFATSCCSLIKAISTQVTLKAILFVFGVLKKEKETPYAAYAAWIMQPK